MDLGSLFLILALALLAGVFISRPFFDRKFSQAWIPAPRPGRTEKQHAQPDHEHLYSSLMAEYERLLAALQELEFDFNMGKIPPEDYPEQRMQLLKSGASVLKHLDELVENIEPETPEARMEAAAVAISLSGEQTSAGVREVDDLEALITARRRKRNEKSAGFCPKCGRPVQTSDVFCPRCGCKL
jgi:rubrerythrin